jgi:hypothetical protein
VNVQRFEPFVAEEKEPVALNDENRRHYGSIARSSLSSAKREVEWIGVRIKKPLTLRLDDEIAVDEGKAEIRALDARRKELQAQLETGAEPPALLHPEMAALYRQKVTTLAQALQHPETRMEATEALRGLIDAIGMTPDEGAPLLQGLMVAGARNKLYRRPEVPDVRSPVG